MTLLYDAGLPTLSELAVQTSFITAENGGEPGLLEESFATKDLSGSSKRSTVKHVNVAGIGWDAISGDLDDILRQMEEGSSPAISRRYTGFFKAETATSYLVALTGGGESNGDRVTIDGKVVIDDWTQVRAFEPHLTMPLSAGMHKVVVESWQNGPVGGQLRFAIAPEATVVSERAKQLAAKADVVVVAAGYSVSKDGTSESEGGDRTFDLPFGQDALIRAMTAANPKTIVAVTSGGNFDSTSWIDKVPALLECWYGGQAGGRATAEILFGEVNPSGHLPATFERRIEDNPVFHNYYPEGDSKRVVYKEGIFVGYRGYEQSHTAPLFPFGFGLSYTMFGYSNLKVTRGSGHALATVDFDVTNSGQRKGSDVAQIYVSDPSAKVPRPLHELKGFERVELGPGETKHISVTLDPRAFAYYNVGAKRWTIDPGQFKVEVGDSLASLPLSADLELSRSAIPEMPLEASH